MRQLSSHFTPFLKFVLPWTIIVSVIIGTITAFVRGKYSTGIATIIIATPIVGFMKTMLMGLKTVLIDRKNKLLIIKGSPDESIQYEDIREILVPWTPPYIATVTLNKTYSFGNSFTFIPYGDPFSSDSYDEELKKKIRN